MNDEDFKMVLKEDREFIKNNISIECRYEQLAEEACELGQAALKMARILRKENPTPVSFTQSINNLVEEFDDVMLLGYYFGLITLDQISSDSLIEIANKSNRWVERIKNAKQND